MLRKIFLILIGFLVCLSFISAGSVAIKPSEVEIGGSVEITIDIEGYGSYVWFYEGDSINHLHIIDLGCEDTCYGKRTFEYVISDAIFDVGMHSLVVYSYDDHEYFGYKFDIVEGESEQTDFCHPSPTSSGYCDIEFESFCEILECSECESCLTSCEVECAEKGQNVHYCTSSGCHCSTNEVCSDLPEQEISCTDSDVTAEYPDGKNYYVGGIVADAREDPPQSKDYCYDGDQLFEHFCGEDGYFAELYFCPDGCKEGACIEICEDGTAYNSCSEAKPKYCQEGELINDCSICGCDFGYECQDGGSCEEVPLPDIGPNTKSKSLYSDKEVFLVSDSDWKNVLPFVPVGVWTEGKEIKKYGFLIYHEEEERLWYPRAFDADSIIYFMQQYNPSKVTIIGETPQELDNLLITERSFGAGLEQGNLQRINLGDYLSYWDSFNRVVYVQDDYELALLASTYASLINAPLVIEGSRFDSENLFSGRNIICVGSVSPAGRSCSESETYNLEQLRDKYKAETNTDKVILVNSDDWTTEDSRFYPEKSSEKIYEIYSKTSLNAPILASAKHELILSTTATDYQDIDSFIEPKLSGMNYLTIIAALDVIPHRTYSHGAFGSDIYWALDQHFYADTDGDFESDVAVGRIAGITISDVSSYIARDLFYDSFQKTNNMKFMASSFLGTLAVYTNFLLLIDSLKWSRYNVVSSTTAAEVADFGPVEWENQDLIYYTDHGSSGWSGIDSDEIPELKNSLIASASCSTVSTMKGGSFWANAMRKGSIGYAGAVSVTYLSSNYYPFVKNIYQKNYPTIGDAFKDADSSSGNVLMTTLIGDPTLSLISCTPEKGACISDKKCCSGEGCKMFSCGYQQKGEGCLFHGDCEETANCIWFSCKGCLGAGTPVNIFTQGECCDGWEESFDTQAGKCAWRLFAKGDSCGKNKWYRKGSSGRVCK